MLYSSFYLQQRIKEEKFRTCRTGSPFSVVLFNPLKCASQNGNGKRKATLKETVKVLEQNSRETDIKGWWNRNTLAIVLLDTEVDGASEFIDNFLSTIKANGHSHLKTAEKSDFRIHTFPNGHRVEKTDKDVSGNDSYEKHQGPKKVLRNEDHDVSTWDGSRGPYTLIKRSMDILFSGLGLIVLSPIFLLCAVLIKLDSPGPIFYRQTRVSRDGKFFTFLKFRSMVHDADPEIHANHVRNLANHRAGLSCNGHPTEKTYKLIEDERVTRFGKFLRKTSLDEFPQLINVLKGDMSLVGPRPHPVYEAQLYKLWQSHRLDIKPGITCLGQIYGRCNTEYEDVYRLDLQYLKKASLPLDLKILFKTIPVVFSRNGAC